MSGNAPPRDAILDTSVVVALPQLDAQELPTASTVSMITLAELQRGLYMGRPSVRAARRQRYQAIRTFVDVAVQKVCTF